MLISRLQEQHRVVKGTRLWAIFRGHTLTEWVYREGEVIEKLSICKQAKKQRNKTILSEKHNVHIFSQLFYSRYSEE